MAAFTTIATVGGLVLGAAAKGVDTVMQRNAAKKQERRIDAAEAAAKTAAREQSLLDGAREDTGADVSLGKGSQSQSTETTGQAGAGAATTRAGSTTKRVGGVKKRKTAGGLAGTISRGVGL